MIKKQQATTGDLILNKAKIIEKTTKKMSLLIGITLSYFIYSLNVAEKKHLFGIYEEHAEWVSNLEFERYLQYFAIQSTPENSLFPIHKNVAHHSEMITVSIVYRVISVSPIMYLLSVQTFITISFITKLN